MNLKAFAWATMLLCTAMSCTSRMDNKESSQVSVQDIAQVEVSSAEPPQISHNQEQGGEIPGMPPEQQQSPRQKNEPAVPVPVKPVAPEWDKKIVKTARLQVEVKDYHNFGQQVAANVMRFGGYVSGEEQQASDYRLERTMTIRVPVEQFDGTVAALVANTEAVTERSITADDVTSQVIDGRSRLEAKRQVRLRYLELLKSAKNMGEIITVQKEINAIQEEIERVSGQLNLLQNTSAMSTIHLSFFQVLKPSVKPESRSDFLVRVGNAFKTGWLWIGEIFLALVYLWPLVIGGIVSVVLYRRRKNSARRARVVASPSTV